MGKRDEGGLGCKAVAKPKKLGNRVCHLCGGTVNPRALPRD